jgi:hypothetical protein
MRATGQFQRHVNSGMLFHTCPPFAMSGRINLTAHSEQGPLRHLTHMNCKIWYLISQTVSDDDAYCGDIDDCSVRAFAVKPAPSARRHAALGLTARRGRANPATVPLMHSTAMAPVTNQRTFLSDNVRQVECWFSHIMPLKTARHRDISRR